MTAPAPPSAMEAAFAAWWNKRFGERSSLAPSATHRGAYAAGHGQGYLAGMERGAAVERERAASVRDALAVAVAMMQRYDQHWRDELEAPRLMTPEEWETWRANTDQPTFSEMQAMLRDALAKGLAAIDAQPIDALIAASSLGTPEAVAVRAKTPPDVAERIVKRAAEWERGGRGSHIPKTAQHDAGAYARCSYCGRYCDRASVLMNSNTKCECGKVDGWSGSFEPPGPDAKWSPAEAVAGGTGTR